MQQYFLLQKMQISDFHHSTETLAVRTDFYTHASSFSLK